MVRSPVLSVRSTDPPQTPPGTAAWCDHRPFGHAGTEVPGDRFSLAGRPRAGRTAEVIRTWTEQLAQRGTTAR